MTTTLSIKNDVLIPYGLMNAGYEADLRGNPVPAHWRFKPLTDGSPPLSRLEAWELWRAAALDQIADVLWPVYDASAHAWRGRAVEQMDRLCRTDLGLLLYLQEGPQGRQFEQRPDSPLRSGDCPIHREWFVFEDDDSKPFGSNHQFYDRTVNPDVLRSMPILFNRGLTNKSANVDLQFKKRLQRPRPYQCALFFGRADLSFEQANSSMTPSMCSGHCLEGLIAVGTIMEALIEDGTNFSDDAWTALEQYAVDIGDRRVMAGVHWPSDNLASWILVMQLAEGLFSTREVKKRLWTAISERSFIYRKIVDWVEIGAGQVYEPALAVLREASESPGEPLAP